MTFLSPQFLWLLPLVTLPILIHLLAKRSAKVIDFPSLIFLKRLEQEALKKFNLKQLVLLLLRMGILLLIILIFAQPTYNPRTLMNVHFGKSDLLLVVLDNTASTYNVFDEIKGPWLEGLRSEMEANGVEVQFCTLHEFKLTADYAGIEASFRDAFISTPLQQLNRQVDLDQFARKSVLWVGDGQDALRILEAFQDWVKFIYLIHSQDAGAIVNLKIPSHNLRLGDAYEIGVAYLTSQSGRIASLELSVNGERINQSSTLEGEIYQELLSKVISTGFQEGVVSKETDDQAYNDARYFSFSVEQSIPVNIVTTASGSDIWQLLKSTLEKRGLNINVDITRYDALEGINWQGRGTIIVDDASKLPAHVWESLAASVAIGEQLILFGGAGNEMQEVLNLSEPLSIHESENPIPLLESVDKQLNNRFPVLEDILQENRLKIHKRYTIGGAELATTWIRYADDQPFLGLTPLGKGRIIWVNTLLQPAASNFAFLGIFPALLLDLCQYSPDAGLANRGWAIVGDTLVFSPGIQPAEGLFRVQRPDEASDFQQPGADFKIRYAKTDLPGFYRLVKGHEVLDIAAVNVSSHEAAALDEDTIAIGEDIQVIEDRNSIAAVLQKNNTGRALWPFLIVLLLLMWVLETYLSRIRSSWRQNA